MESTSKLRQSSRSGSSVRLVVGKRPRSIVQPLLTDLYEITMAYGYWKAGKILDYAVFDLFFRTNPFGGEFTIFAGLDDCVRYLTGFRFLDDDIKYLRKVMPRDVEDAFFDYLTEISTKEVTVYAPPEGTVVFPRIPLLRVEGPLIIVQLLETTFLNLVNFASLVATNAARYRLAAGENKTLVEMGLRRAQGPDGALTASKYCYVGGFDATSNVLAGRFFDIPLRGTLAHSYVSSFQDLSEVKDPFIGTTGATNKNLVDLSLHYREGVAKLFRANEGEMVVGELAAFVSWALAYPSNFVALVDTYEMRMSGLYNFLAVALALNDCGFQAVGIRIDSGDLAYLSLMARNAFVEVGKFYKIPWFEKMMIIASNSIDEKTILSLNEQGHSLNALGIGTKLVTCSTQPALGCIYKLVELNGMPRMKLTQESVKLTLPGKKRIYRLFGDKYALADVIMQDGDAPPLEGTRILCRHPFFESKRAWVNPKRIESLLNPIFERGEVVADLPDLQKIRKRVDDSLDTIRPDTLRLVNATPYKVSMNQSMYEYLHNVWLRTAPIGQLK